MQVLTCVHERIFSVSLAWAGGVGYKGETNSSLGDDGKHNYVQFSS